MPTTISTRTVEDTLFASLRFWGQPDEVPARFQVLYEQVKPYAIGQMTRLYHGHDPQRGYDIEVGVPVSSPVVSGEITTRTLPGGPLLCATHLGPPEELAQARQQVIDFVREHAILIAEEPAYTVWLEGRDEHGDDTSRYVTEIRLPLMLPRWIATLADGLERYGGAAIRQQVLGADDVPGIETPALEKTCWAQALMTRLDAAIPDEGARRDLLNPCAHVFPQERIDALRADYQRLGSLDRLLETMGRDRSVGGTSFYAHPYREGSVIIETKLPADPEGYANATDPKEKRASACFCPPIRLAIRQDIPVSGTFCHCGAGWFRRLWEGVLERPVWIEVQQTVLRGDDCCRFAVHIPDDVV